MKQAILFHGGLALGVPACTIGVYMETSMHYHERAYGVFAAGMACVLASFVSKYARRGRAADLWLSTSLYVDATVFGILVFAAGAALKFLAHYHGRAYAFLLVGTMCLLTGLVRNLLVPGIARARYLFTQRRSSTAALHRETLPATKAPDQLSPHSPGSRQRP